MRNDFYCRCLEAPEFAAIKTEGTQFDLLPPTLDELRQIIVKPARAAGLVLEESPDGERLEAVLQESAARHPATLPLLEFTLDELYRRAQQRGSNLLSLGDYRVMGMLEGALARRAEDVLSGLTEETRAALGEVMSMAVGISAQERSAVPIDLRRFPAATPARHLIDALVAARLMTTDLLPDATPTARLVHDALLTHWQRLAAWIADNDELLRVRARVEAAHHHWEESHRDPSFALAPGKPLAEAEDLVKRTGAHLAPEVVQFVEASTNEAAKRRRAKRRLTTAVAGLIAAIVTASAVWISREQASAARAEESKALAHELLDDFGDTSSGIVRQLVNVAGASPDGTVANIDNLSKLFDELVEKTGESPELHAKKGRLLSAKANVYANLADVATAERLAREADQEFALALTSDAENLEWAVARGRNLGDLSNYLLNQHRFEEAGIPAERLRTLAEDLVRRRPNELEGMVLRCQAQRLIGLAKSWTGDFYGARTAIGDALHKIRSDSAPFSASEIHRLSDAQIRAIRQLCMALMNYCGVASEWEPASELERLLREGLELAEGIADAAGDDAAFAANCADLRMNYAMHIQDSRPEEARLLVEQVHSSAIAHTALNPRSGEWTRLKLWATFILGDLTPRTKDAERARLGAGIDRLKVDMANATATAEKHPENIVWRNLAIELRSLLGTYQIQHARYAPNAKAQEAEWEAGKRLQQSVAQERLAIIAKNPDDLTTIRGVRGLDEDSWKYWIDYHRRRATREPENASWPASVAEGLFQRGLRSAAAGDRRDADYRESLQIYETLGARFPRDLLWPMRAADVVKQLYLNADDQAQEDLLQNALSRYERLVKSAPQWDELHKQHCYFRTEALRQVCRQERWPEFDGALSALLNAIDARYREHPQSAPADLLKPRGPALSSIRAQSARDDAAKAFRDMLTLDQHLRIHSLKSSPQERAYRLLDCILTILDNVHDLGRPGDELAAAEAFLTVRSAETSLDELEKLGHSHPVFAHWRRAFAATYAELPDHRQDVPAELLPAWDRMDYRSVVTQWLKKDDAPRELIVWLDREVRIAQRAVWRHPWMWTLIHLPPDVVDRLLNVEAIDSLAYGAQKYTLAPETIQLLQGTAILRGDSFAFLKLLELDQSADVASALTFWLSDFVEGKPPVDGELKFVSGQNFTYATWLAEVDGAKLQASAPRVDDLTCALIAARKIYDFELSDENRAQLLSVSENESLAPRTRLLASVLAAEELLFQGKLHEAELLLEAGLKLDPRSSLVTQDLIWLKLTEAATADAPRRLDQETELRIQLLNARVPHHPFQRLLEAWWKAQHGRSKSALAAVSSLTDDPVWGGQFVTFDILARIAAAEGKNDKVAAYLNKALEKVPVNEQSRPYRQGLEKRLTALSSAK